MTSALRPPPTPCVLPRPSQLLVLLDKRYLFALAALEHLLSKALLLSQRPRGAMISSSAIA